MILTGSNIQCDPEGIQSYISLGNLHPCVDNIRTSLDEIGPPHKSDRDIMCSRGYPERPNGDPTRSKAVQGDPKWFTGSQNSSDGVQSGPEGDQCGPEGKS